MRLLESESVIALPAYGWVLLAVVVLAVLVGTVALLRSGRRSRAPG